MKSNCKQMRKLNQEKLKLNDNMRSALKIAEELTVEK